MLNKALGDRPEIRDRIIGEARERIAGALAEGNTFEPARLRNGPQPTMHRGGGREGAPDSDTRFVNAVRAIHRVIYDTSGKPPATIQ